MRRKLKLWVACIAFGAAIGTLTFPIVGTLAGAVRGDALTCARGPRGRGRAH
jgi:hypothetical protein